MSAILHKTRSRCYTKSVVTAIDYRAVCQRESRDGSDIMPIRTEGDGHDQDGARAACLTATHPATAASQRAARTTGSRGGVASRVGSFCFWFADQRWEWSDEVYRMHGYEPGSVVPTTELVLSHKHPDDRPAVQDLLDQVLHNGGSFSSRHRFYDTAGDEHGVIVVADRILDETGAVVGTRGY